MEFIWYLGLVALIFIIFVVVQLVRLALADADFKLLWAARNPQLEKLAGKVVWVTGASMGIGEQLCYELARSGCKLVISARQQDELNRVKQKLIDKYHYNADNVMVLPFDMLNMSSFKAITDSVIARFGQIDVLVNNAGRSQRCLAEETPVEVDRAIMELNFFAPVALTRAVMPHMISRRQGHLVVTSSVAGKMSAPFSSTYSASKHAIQGFYDTVRIELAQYNIDVTLVCAGPIYSNIQNNAFTKNVDEKYGVGQAAGSCMDVDRCAYLMAVGMAARLKELWISKQPILAVTYLAQYAPDWHKKILIKMGMKQVLAMRKVKPT